MNFNSPELSDSSDNERDFSMPLPALNIFARQFPSTPNVHGPFPLDDTSLEHFSDEDYLTDEDELDSRSKDAPLAGSEADFLNNQSSPILAKNREDAVAHRRRKGAKRRKSTLAAQREEKEEAKEAAQIEGFEAVLSFMESKKVHFGDLLSYIFNPDNGKGHIHYHELFIKHGSVSQILDWWMKYSRSARDQVRDWAVDHVTTVVTQEARRVTKSQELQTLHRPITGALVKSYSLAAIHQRLEEELAPISMQLISALATSRHAVKHTEKRKERTKKVITSMALACLGEYSHANNLPKRMNALYLYATGAQRQTIAVLSSMGISESYGNLVSRNIRRSRKNKQANSELTPATQLNANSTIPEPILRTGTIPQLSQSMRINNRKVGETGLYQSVYDNINPNFKNAEQVIGRHDSQENGTCATIIPLFEAKLEDIKVGDYQDAFLKAPPLEITDILHTPDESDTFQKNLIFTILDIIVKQGGDQFKKYEKNLKDDQPATKDKIKLHHSEIYPLPPWRIDESTIVGNAEVDKAIVDELRLNDVPKSAERVRFQGGDQLSIARLRALELIRAGQEDGYNAFFWGVWIAGLFHAKLADTQGTLLTHWGKPNTADRNPGSLWFHNACLNRLPITITSLPPFRTCRDIIFVSLYARVLHCLLLVANCKSLEEYTKKFDSWDILVKHAQDIYEKYANTKEVEDLRWKRDSQKRKQGADATEKPTEGDQVFENSLLFMRDALISREFTNAVKSGDSGRVVLVLKVWALSFRGNGRTKYAHEMLHLIHNLEKVWDDKIRKIVLNNWLVNPTGKEESWVEIDLMQEHLNFWVKTWYKAHGVNGSWDWLAMIGPCVDVLRQLARNFNKEFGSDQGTRHAPPDLSKDIETLMKVLDTHNVYRLQKGRLLDDDEEPVKDVIQIGIFNLTAGTKSPLSDYNNAFQRLQRFRRRKNVAKMMEELSAPTPSSDPLMSSHTPIPTPDPSESTPAQPQATQSHSELEEVITDALVDDGETRGTTDEGTIFAAMLYGRENDETLPRLTADDVAFDMDLIAIVEEDELSEESDSDSEDEGGDTDLE